jgi:hypothetical protein
MAYEELTFSFEEVLTSTKMNKVDTNIDEVRKFHKGSTSPAALVAGAMWIYDGATPWTLRVYDGTDQIDIGVIDPANDLFFLQSGNGVYLDDDTAAAGPRLGLRRQSDTPIAADKIAVVAWEANDSAAAIVTYAALRGEIIDPSTGAESGRVIAKAKIGGVDTQEFGWGGGVVVGTPSTGFSGAGILNAENDLQVDGVSVVLPGEVSQSDLQTSSGSGSSSGVATMPGGQYGFYPRTSSTNGAEVVLLDSFKSSLGSYIDTTVANSYNWHQRYMTASPPFNLGDGDVHGFIFLRIRDSVLLDSWVADVPPWAYNGPTDIRPHIRDRKTGRKYRRVSRSNVLAGLLERGEISLPQMREMLASSEYQGHDLIEIDHSLKNADMGLFPHPFGTVDPDDRVILLDPMDELVATLLELQEQGEDVVKLLMTRKIRPKTTMLDRAGPADVIQVGITA